jgi:hypothetical protein
MVFAGTQPAIDDRFAMEIGTTYHRDLFCANFIETHRPFEPENLPWPRLEGALLDRLRAFPLWSYARTIERRAGQMVTAFAQTVEDPVIREAVALQGYEETRHARLMQHVLDRYGIHAPDLQTPPAPATREDFVVFGYGECTDSFLGFGAFALARQKQLFPESILSIFDQILYEEARHITFFVNWFRYEEKRAGRDRFGERHLAALRGCFSAVKGALSGERGGVAPEFPADAAAEFSDFIEGLTPVGFLEAALAENRRFLSRLDPRLPKPGLVPTLALLALLGLRALPPRKDIAIPRRAPERTIVAA